MAGWGRRPTSQTPVTTTTNVKHFADPSGAARTCLNDIMQVIAAMKVSSQKLGSAADSLRLRRVAQTHLQRGQEACDSEPIRDVFSIASCLRTVLSMLNQCILHFCVQELMLQCAF